jgi:hypothetical protein
METDKLNQFKDVMATKEARLHHKQQMERLTSLEKSLVVSLRQLVQFLDGKTTKTEVVNQLKSIKTPDIDKVVSALEKLDSSVKGGKIDISPLVKGINALEKQLTELPKSLPKAPEQLDTIKVSNLAELDFKSLEKAIKGLKLEAPEVNVAAPEVKVDAPDLKPLQESLLDVIKAVKAIPEVPQTDLTGVEKRLDESNKKLQTLIEQPKGGGGGGSGVSYQDANGRPVRVEVDSSGNVPVSITGTLVAGVDYDYLDVQQTDSDTETFVFKTGGSGGTTVRTIVVNYTSSTKSDIDNVTWT